MAFTGDHRRNIREALDRLKLRAPPLPEDLEAIWETFRQDQPRRLREKYGVKLGAVLIDRLRHVLEELGSHAVMNPALPSKKPRVAKGGNPKAFELFVRELLKLQATDNALRL